jgi:hypothetical protein
MLRTYTIEGSTGGFFSASESSVPDSAQLTITDPAGQTVSVLVSRKSIEEISRVFTGYGDFKYTNPVESWQRTLDRLPEAPPPQGDNRVLHPGPSALPPTPDADSPAE